MFSPPPLCSNSSYGCLRRLLINNGNVKKSIIKENENQVVPEVFVSKIPFRHHLIIKENPAFADFKLCVMSRYLEILLKRLSNDFCISNQISHSETLFLLVMQKHILT